MTVVESIVDSIGVLAGVFVALADEFDAMWFEDVRIYLEPEHCRQELEGRELLQCFACG